MRKQTFYIADDGTKFDTAEECREYEEAKNYNPVMLDDDLNPARDFGDASFILVRDQDDLKRLELHVNLYGYNLDGIDAPGSYLWNDSNHVLIDTVIERLNDAKRILKEMGNNGRK